MARLGSDGSKAVFADGRELVANNAFSLCAFEPTAKAELVAHCDGAPAVVSIPPGGMVLLRPVGLNGQPLFEGKPQKAWPVRHEYHSLERGAESVDAESPSSFVLCE